jgi:hypothetical protein
MTPTTTHRGYSILFSEVEEVWRCQTLWLEDASLSKLKQKINKVDAGARRTDVMLAYLISYGTVDEVKITSLTDEKTHAWVIRGRRRSKEELSRLVQKMPETTEQIEQAEKLRQEMGALRDKLDKTLADLPRMTPEMLMKKS